MYNAECFFLPQWLSKLHVLCLIGFFSPQAVFLFIFIDRVGYIQMLNILICEAVYYQWWENWMQMKFTESRQLKLIPQMEKEKKEKTPYPNN